MKISRKQFVAATAASAFAVRADMSVEARPLSPAARGPGPVPVELTVNNHRRKLTIEPRVSLLDALRDRLGLTGTKKGCDQGTCGACTVLVNGRRINSCLTLAIMHELDEITTIEGLAQGDALHPLQEAFIEKDAFQCGYCTPGQIVSAAGYLNEGGSADADVVRRGMSGNICRCGCYPHIVEAVAQVKGAS